MVFVKERNNFSSDSKCIFFTDQPSSFVDYFSFAFELEPKYYGILKEIFRKFSWCYGIGMRDHFTYGFIGNMTNTSNDRN
jgi:hypothetical protein